MSANYEWQRQQVEDRISARMQEGARHRQVKAARADRPDSTPWFLAPLKGLWSVLTSLGKSWGPVAGRSREDEVPRERWT